MAGTGLAAIGAFLMLETMGLMPTAFTSKWIVAIFGICFVFAGIYEAAKRLIIILPELRAEQEKSLAKKADRKLAEAEEAARRANNRVLQEQLLKRH